MSTTKNWEVTGIECEEYNEAKQHELLKALGYVKVTKDSTLAIGQRLLHSCDNGWECTGTVAKNFKNGSIRLTDDKTGKTRNFPRAWLWFLPA